MVRITSLALALLVLSSASQEPSGLIRVRLIVTTTGRGVDIRIEGATLASFTSVVTAGRQGVHASATGHVMGLGRNVPGETAEAQFDAVLARVTGPLVTWHVTAEDETQQTQIEVYSVPSFDRPKLVDRFTLDRSDTRFTSQWALLDGGGGLRLDRARPRLVLANFYAWYNESTWRDERLADRPLRLYSTDSDTDLDRLVHQAHGAGVDAFVVSWQNGPTDMYDRRLQRVLDAAARGGMRVSAGPETFVANPALVWSSTTDPQTMLDWIVTIVDRFGSHPAYLRIDGRPVIFIYASSQLQDAPWSDIRARLRASGRNPLLIGEQFESRLLAYFDGEYQYINVAWPEPYHDLYDAQGLRTRTFHLLRPEWQPQRRFWVASVTPGYDDQRLPDRSTPLTVDRQGGRVYDDMWSAAIDTEADWIIITSWNEWWENTEIEPSERYGTLYLDRTRFWASQFKARDAERDQRLKRLQDRPD